MYNMKCFSIRMCHNVPPLGFSYLVKQINIKGTKKHLGCDSAHEWLLLDKTHSSYKSN